MSEGVTNKTSKPISLTLSTSAEFLPIQSHSGVQQPPQTQQLIQKSTNPSAEINVQVVPMPRQSQSSDRKQTQYKPRPTQNAHDIDNNEKLVEAKTLPSVHSRNVIKTVITASTPYPTTEKDIISTTTVRAPEVVRKNIHNFVVSDAQPQSFQPPPTARQASQSQSQQNSQHQPLSNNAFVYRPSHDSLPTTTLAAEELPLSPTTTDQTIKFVLTSKLNPVNYKETSLDNAEITQGSVEIVPLRQEEEVIEAAVRTTSSRPIEPTTYAPATRAWKSVKTPQPFAPAVSNSVVEGEVDIHDSQESDSNANFQHQRPNSQNVIESTTTPATKIVSKFSYRYIEDKNRRNQPNSPEPTASFTARSHLFKEVVNRTYETSTPSKLFVSPYTSLRSILNDDSVKATSLRPFSRQNQNRNQPEMRLSTFAPTPQPSSRLRNYFYITSAPQNMSTTAPTTTTSTTTESTTSTTTTTTTTEAPAEFADWVPISSTDVNRLAKAPKYSEYNPRNRFISYSTENSLEEATTYSPKIRFSSQAYETSTSSIPAEQTFRRKVIRTRPVSSQRPEIISSNESDDILDIIRNSQFAKILESVFEPRPKSAAQQYDFRTTAATEGSSTIDTNSKVVEITDRPSQYYSHYRNLSTERNLANAIHASTTQHSSTTSQRYVNSTSQRPELKFVLRERFRATMEMPEFNIPTESEQKSFRDIEAESERSVVNEYNQNNNFESTSNINLTKRPQRVQIPTSTTEQLPSTTRTTTTTTPEPTTTTTTTTTPTPPITTTTPTSTTTWTTQKSSSTTNSMSSIPPRVSRVNAAIKTTIAAVTRVNAPPPSSPPTTFHCTDNTPNTKCNEILSRYQKKNKITKYKMRIIIFLLFSCFFFLFTNIFCIS